MSGNETTLDEKVGVIAQEEGVPYELFRKLIFAESSDSHFDKNGNVKRSPKGALGYGQLMPATAAELGVDPTDPMDNLRGAAMYLRQMLDRYDNNAMMALAAYNAGPGAVDKYNGVPPYKETRNYVAKILGVKQDVISPSMDEIAAQYVESDLSSDGYLTRPRMRPDDLMMDAEQVKDPYATPLTRPIQYAPAEETTGIGAFEQFMPREEKRSELGPVDLNTVGREEVGMYQKYTGAPMTFQQARAAEQKARSGGIGPLNYIARNMFG